MTEAFVYRCGRAAAEYFGNTGVSPEIVVGRDTRESGPGLETALCQGLSDGGARPRKVGVLPTAAVSLLTVHYRAAAGVMISASHNEYSDNGIKFFGPQGYKLTDEVEIELEHRIGSFHELPKSFSLIEADFSADPEAFAIYSRGLIQTFPRNFSLGGLKIMVDGANGSAWQSTPAILRRLGAEVSTVADSPDGKNINAGCGSLHPEMLQSLMHQAPGGIGLCHDGDADRLVMLDEDGMVLDGDELLAIVGLHALKCGDLPGETIVATVMSNLGLDEAFSKAGAKVLRTAVGDRYVLEGMQAGGYTIGGEQSGHMLFLDCLPTGDGLLSALRVLQVMVSEQKPLRELRRVMRKYPQKLFNLKVKKKTPLSHLTEVQEAVSLVEAEMGVRGRVLLRYSGTENKLRLLLEYAEAEAIEALAEKILIPIRARLC
jgi:phosphoglucosamine mutase